MTKRTLFHLSVFTLIGFSVIGYILLRFHNEVDFWEMMSFSLSKIKGIGVGLCSGLVAAWLGILLLRHPLFDSVNDFFGNLMSSLKPEWYHILFYSFCAGVGEEILFRGAIQSYLHVFPTAIIFVLLHGYLNPKNWKMSVYGLFLVFVSAGMGYLMKFQGIYAAISAHFIYDVVMFWQLKKTTNAKEA